MPHLHDDGNGNIGAVVRYTLVVIQQISQNETALDGTGTLLQTADVIGADLGNQTVDDLLQRLYLGSQFGAVAVIGTGGEVEDLLQGVGEHLDLLLGLGREGDLLVVQLLGHLGQVAGVVAQTLEVADGVEDLGDDLAVLIGETL